MLPNNQRSPVISEITFKKHAYTNNGHCNIFLPKVCQEFNPEEIEKKMPKFNYYNRLGKELIQKQSIDQFPELQNQQKQDINQLKQDQQGLTQIVTKADDIHQQTEKQIVKPKEIINNQTEDESASLQKLVQQIDQQYSSTNKTIKCQTDSQNNTLQKSSIFQLSSQNIISPKYSGKINDQLVNQKTKTIKEQQKSDINSDIRNTLQLEQQLLNQNKNLVKQIYKLNDLKLLNAYQCNSQKQQGIFKIEFIYNDYHSRSTNPGVNPILFKLSICQYARNGYGSFFTK